MVSKFAVRVLVCIAVGLFGLTLSAQAQPGPAKWRSSKISLSVSTSLASAPNIQGNVSETLQKSLAVWQQAGDLSINIDASESQSVSEKGVRGDGVSLLSAASTAENLKLFPQLADSPAAVTRVFSDVRGNIVEADIVLNPYARFSTDGTYGTFDLQDTLTHEIGHLLGLRHSPIWGSIMYEKGATSFGPGSYAGSTNVLPEVDGAAIRALYGPPVDEFACCGSVSGRISGVPLVSKGIDTIVWLEDGETGRLMAAAVPSRDGSYRIAGVKEGKYRLLVRSADGAGRIASNEAAIAVELGEAVKSNLALEYGERPFNADLIGTTPQLGRQVARLQPGRPHRLFLGGSGDPSQILRVYRSGDATRVSEPGFSTSSHSESVKMIGFDLSSADSAPGTYTLVIEYANGAKDFLVGALSLSNLETPVFSSVRE